MQYIGIVKRAVPFILTFSLGLFIASFFVPLTAPSFEWKNRKRHEQRGDRHFKKYAEKEALKKEIRELKRELEAARLELRLKQAEAENKSVILSLDEEPLVRQEMKIVRK